MTDKLRDAAQQDDEREAFEAWVAKVQPTYWRAEAWQTEAWAMWQSISAALAQQDAQALEALIQASKQALGALIQADQRDGMYSYELEIAALRTALAQQDAQEPLITVESSLRFRLDCTKEQLEAAERENAELRGRLRGALAQQDAQAVPLTGKQRVYLASAWAMLEDYASDQRQTGNDSIADGADASAHEIKLMLTAAPTPPAQEKQS